ncbi:hypothetical protein ScPMuIL_004289 [Solemya velum]
MIRVLRLICACPCHFGKRSRLLSQQSAALPGNPKICVVGSGPAGFYTAQQLLKGNSLVEVDIYEKLPVPFGLVRFGVAPDHPEVKNVINTFTQTANNERCRFLGNVKVGEDISIQELKEAYSTVVLAYGVDADRVLGIPGEDSQNVLSARRFVGWYNGLPKDSDLEVDLDTDNVVVLGHGNVALDVARVLLTPIDSLAKTDISQHALEVLSRSKVKRVTLVGRRGPLQVAFTIKELREMTKLPGCLSVLHKHNFHGLDTVSQGLPRPRKRLTDLMYKTCMAPTGSGPRQWELQFLLSPTEFISDTNNRVSAVKFAQNRLEGSDLETQRAVRTEETKEISCGLVLRSIGYRSIQIDDMLPFDTDRGVVPCDSTSRVVDSPGVYCSGWVGRGPTGVILTTMSDGFETGKVILRDLEEGVLRQDNIGGVDVIRKKLETKGVQVVTFTDWNKINKIEMSRGKSVGKPREKMVNIQDMLKAASS